MPVRQASWSSRPATWWRTISEIEDAAHRRTAARTVFQLVQLANVLATTGQQHARDKSDERAGERQLRGGGGGSSSTAASTPTPDGAPDSRGGSRSRWLSTTADATSASLRPLCCE